MKKQKAKKEVKSAFQKAVVGVVKESKSLNKKGKKFVKDAEKNWKASAPERKELGKSIKKGASDILNKTIKIARKFK